MKSFLVRRWFLIVLTLALLFGIVFASHLERLAQLSVLRSLIVSMVLFVMALPLPAGSLWDTLRRPCAPLLAVVINLGLLPLFAWAVSLAMVSLGASADMGRGLLIAGAVPSTLASAAVWTRRAGGNDSVSILVTIVTNAICFLATPLWLVRTTGESVGIPVGEMIWELLVIVVLPMALAQLLRLVGPVGVWATDRKTPLNVLAQCGVLSIVLFGAVQTGLKLGGAGGGRLTTLDLLLMLIAVLLVHLTMLYAGFAAARALSLGREEAIAVGFSGSQKTLMVGLQVGMDLHITILPMVAYHVAQLLADTVVADRLAMRRAPPNPRP